MSVGRISSIVGLSVIIIIGLVMIIGQILIPDVIPNTILNFIQNSIQDSNPIPPINNHDETPLEEKPKIKQPNITSEKNGDDKLKSPQSHTSYPRQQLVDHALKVINDDRKKAGLEPVKLSQNSAAQIHAEDVLKTRTISHWMTNGEKPYMTYTRLGGQGEVSQNVSFSGYEDPEECMKSFVICETIEPLDEIEKAEHSMMYNDAESDWGHRDNILRPYHTDVSLGIAYDDYTFVLVQNFEDNYIKFTKNISENNGVVSFSGTIKEGSLSGININFDPPPSSSLYQQHKDDKSYQIGDFIASINKPLEGGGYYEPSENTFEIADNWTEEGNFVDISFDISPFVTKAGVYTVSLFLSNNGEDFSITSHSLTENSPLVEAGFRSPKVHYACAKGQLAQFNELKTEYDNLLSQYNRLPRITTSDQEYQNAMRMVNELNRLLSNIKNFRCGFGSIPSDLIGETSSSPPANSDLQVIQTLQIAEEGDYPSDGLYQPKLAAETTIVSNENGKIIFQYFVPQSHSCDAKLHVFLDEKETVVTEWMGNYQKTNSLPLDSGRMILDVEPNKSYKIKFVPEARDSGIPCTATEYFKSWYGEVKFYG